MSLLFNLLVYFCDQFVATNIHHSMDVTAVFVNNQHGMKRRGQDFDKENFVFEGVHSKEVDRRISWEKMDKACCS